MKKQPTGLLIAIFVIIGCNSTKKTVAGGTGPALLPMAGDSTTVRLNGRWELNYISGPRIAFAGLYPDKKPMLLFKLPDGEATGHTGCNPFSCNFTIAGNNLHFGDFRSTMMACLGQGEQIFVKTLRQVTAFSISSDTTLNLIMGDIATMRFTRK